MLLISPMQLKVAESKSFPDRYQQLFPLLNGLHSLEQNVSHEVSLDDTVLMNMLLIY